MWRRIAERYLGDPNGTANLVRRVLNDYARPHWTRYALALLLMAVAAAATALTAYLVGRAINETYLNRSFAGVAMVAGAAILLFVIKGLCSYGQAVTLARIGNHITAANQRRMVDTLLQQSLSYFADRHSSEFTARIGLGATAPSHVLNMLVRSFGRDALTLIGLAVVMVIQAPVLSLVALLVMPPSILAVRHLNKRARAIAQTEFAGGMRVIEVMQEMIQGLRMVKVLNLEGEMQRRAAGHIESIEHAANKLARVSNRSSPLMEALGGIAVGLVMLYGGYQVLLLGRPPGEFVSFITAFLLAYEPAKRLARLNIELNSVIVGVQVLFEVLDLPGDAKDAGKPPLRLGPGRIEFVDVSFHYRANLPVLRGLSFAAQPRQVTALVGPSGGGKTTIFNLLLRFFDADAGAILIDGQDVTAVSRESLRRHVAYVGQDVFLFRGSIRENIAFGRSDAREEDIVAAAEAAHAHEFISRFPAGYDTPVGEHGLQLSGGQRQRIAVARAFIRNAPILLLDEPTASLDSESERRVQQAVARLSEGRTTLVIAHRLHTITRADVIHVVEDGRVVESGSHAELMRARGRYADFYGIQFGTSEPAPPPAGAPLVTPRTVA
ncbi:MAG: ABC transporter ATP-binding protein [Bradyrhizobiaceae bacterium]|nr:MAG: ABC transporter ATP-binding protein [Bradyrhizobiaceae bacterium]